MKLTKKQQTRYKEYLSLGYEFLEQRPAEGIVILIKEKKLVVINKKGLLERSQGGVIGMTKVGRYS